MAHQFGFNNAVAVLGVALTESHVKILKRFVDRIILVLDGDEAGQKRTNEVLELFIAQQVDLRILTLPDNLDPCDFLQQRGADAFAELLATGTVNALEHAFRSATRGLDLERDVHGASQALERLIKLLANAPRLRPDTSSEERLREEKFLQRFAALFRVSEAEVRRRLTALRRRGQDQAPVARASEEPAWRPSDAIDSYERHLFELLLAYPEIWPAVRAEIPSRQITSSALRRIYETGCRLLEAGVLPDFSRLILDFDDPGLKSLLVDLDEQGRAKGSQMAEPAELFNQLQKAFQRREVEKKQAGQLVALRQQDLAEDQEIDLLRKIVQQEKSRQGISDPTDG